LQKSKEKIDMKAFFRFIASTTGRIVRILAGLILIAIGILWVRGIGGWILVIVGLVPLAAGLFDWCVFAPLFGLPFVGPRLRPAVENSESGEVGHD
jgi:sorbitol-specific phosphotransferase system component IIBC